MRSVKTDCTGTIVVYLTICYEEIEKQWRLSVIFIIKHKFFDFKHISSENIKKLLGWRITEQNDLDGLTC